MNDKQYRILIIDDSASDRKIYRRFLHSQTRYIFEVAEAGTAQAALEICRSQAVACLVLDYHLPDLDGLSALPDFRQVTQAPIILITGRPAALVMTEAYRRGVVKYLSKDTVTSAALLEAVYDALDLPY